jgi:hypothetical protein
MGEAKVQLPVLTEENWCYWKKVLFAVLTEKELWDIVKGVETLAEGAAVDVVEAFNKRKRKAVGLLVPIISEKLSHLIPAEPSDPKEIWSALVKHFESKSTFNIYSLEMRLAQMQISETEDPGPWMTKRMEVYQQLAAVGRVVEEKQKITATLAQLPSFYEPLITSLMTQIASQKMELGDVSELLVNYWMQKKKWSDFSESAFSSGKAPHKARSNKNHGGHSKVQCFGCGGKGHMKKECPTVKRKYRYSGSEESSEDESDSGDRGSKHQVGMAQSNYRDRSSRSFAFKASATGKSRDIVIDSGASSHMTPYRDLLRGYRPFSVPEEIKLADGSTVEALGCGRLEFKLHQGIGGSLEECLFVPKLEGTLFSVQAAAKKGYNVTFGSKKVRIRKGSKVLAAGDLREGVYCLDCSVEVPVSETKRVHFAAGAKVQVHGVSGAAKVSGGNALSNIISGNQFQPSGTLKEKKRKKKKKSKQRRSSVGSESQTPKKLQVQENMASGELRKAQKTLKGMAVNDLFCSKESQDSEGVGSEFGRTEQPQPPGCEKISTFVLDTKTSTEKEC